MIKNYFIIAWRNLVRNKISSAINLGGLAVGLATCLLILLYIVDENSYDQQHHDGDRIYRVASVNDKGETWAAASAPVAAGIKNEFPEAEQVARLLTFPDIEKMVLKTNEGATSRQFLESNGYYVDSTFFRLFTYRFKYGNHLTALQQPNSIVLSENIVIKLFGKQDPVNKPVKVLTPFGEFIYTVKGVFEDKYSKSHIQARYFLSMHNNDLANWVKTQTNWTNNNIFYTYVKLKAGTDPKAFEQKLKPFLLNHATAEFKAAGFSKTFFLQPIRSIYLHSAVGGEIAANGNINYLYILGSIAAFILLIACINFMNLATAKSEKRAREVGIRKVIGARKSGLIRQFLAESVMMCIIALAVALTLVEILLPYFNQLTGKKLILTDQPGIMLWIAGLTLLTGLLSGLYPAFYLSAFKPVNILKGKIINNFSATMIRKGLVLFQFTISVCLILAAIVIWQQLSFIKKQQLGFNKNKQLVIPMQSAFKNSESDFNKLRNELVKYPQIKSVTSGSTYPGIPNLLDMLFYAEGKSQQEHVDVRLSAVGNGYTEALGFKILQGRSFSNAFTADSASIILNQTAVKELGYTIANAVGRSVNYDYQGRHQAFKIIGVVNDFNFESLHNTIKPYGFTNNAFGSKYNYVIASFATDDYSKLLASVQSAWKNANPNTPFAYSFLDQDFQHNYENEMRTSAIIVYFTIVAIIIACLGLFGLSLFSAEQRNKEIGLRKVLGATTLNVIALLSKDFIKLVLIAILIASPIGWYVMHRWLQSFAYQVSISWWMFFSAGAISVFIAILTISFQSARAALANPAKSLKVE